MVRIPHPGKYQRGSVSRGIQRSDERRRVRCSLGIKRSRRLSARRRQSRRHAGAGTETRRCRGGRRGLTAQRAVALVDDLTDVLVCSSTLNTVEGDDLAGEETERLVRLCSG